MLYPVDVQAVSQSGVGAFASTDAGILTAEWVYLQSSEWKIFLHSCCIDIQHQTQILQTWFEKY